MRCAIRKSGLILAIAAGLSGGTAGAQQFGGPAQPFNTLFPGRPPSAESSPLRAQVQYQIQLPADRAASLDDQRSAIEAGHAALYALAEHECGALTRAFDGDCRVVTLNVSNANQGFSPSGAMSFNATATIEVTPRRPAPSAPPGKPQ